MADFSKQYCELNDPELPHDFDILQIAEELENEQYIEIICEGFGFVAVAKDAEGNILLAMPTGEPIDEEGIPCIWRTYEEIIEESKNN